MRNLRRWWGFPVLGALVCCAITAWIAAQIAADRAMEGAEIALDGAGLGETVDYVGVNGISNFGRDGLNVTLEGPADFQTAAVTAVEARSEIRRAEYRIADGEFSGGGAGETASGGSAAIDEAEQAGSAPAVGLDSATVTLATAGTKIVLEGSIPDDATRDALITAAVNKYGAANVDHHLVVDPENYTLDGASITLSGQAESAEERDEWFENGSVVAAAAGLDVVDDITVKSVDQSLNELFQLEPIEFDARQATIRPNSEATLDAAAEMINAHPDVGRLKVVGHTDGDGSASANQQLSEARAEAVVSYLVERGQVDAGRLEAEGRGESELLVDPESTPDDKQRNRRIEWEPLT